MSNAIADSREKRMRSSLGGSMREHMAQPCGARQSRDPHLEYAPGGTAMARTSKRAFPPSAAAERNGPRNIAPSAQPRDS